MIQNTSSTSFQVKIQVKEKFRDSTLVICLAVAKVKVLVAHSCLTLCNSMDCSMLGSSVHRISQARTLEGAAIPSLGDLPDSGIDPGSPALQADSLPSEPPVMQSRYVKKICSGLYRGI